MGDPFVHVEFSSRNAEQCKRFYENLFGWKFQFDPKMNYYLYDTGKEPGGGVMQNDQMPPGISVYVGVSDVDAALKKAESLGGTVLRWKEEIPGFGWFGMFRDPEGIPLSVYQSMRPPAPTPKPKRAAARKAKPRAKATRRRRR